MKLNVSSRQPLLDDGQNELETVKDKSIPKRKKEEVQHIVFDLQLLSINWI